MEPTKFHVLFIEQLLECLAGDISSADVIAADEKFADLDNEVTSFTQTRAALLLRSYANEPVRK